MWPCPTRSPSSVPATKSTATTPPTLALQLAKPAGRPPREVAEIIAGRLRQAVRHRRGRRRRSRVPQRPACRGRSRRDRPGRSSPAGRRYGHADAAAGSGSTWSSSAPTRPVRSTSAARAGPRSATRSPACSRPAAPTSPTRVLLQRRRWRRSTGSPSRWYGGRGGQPTPEDGYAGEYVAEIAAQVLAANPGLLDKRPRRRGCRRVPPRRRRADARRDQVVAATTSGSTSTSSSPSGRCTTRARSSAAARHGCAAQGHVYEPDGAVWLRTTDFGDDKDRVLVKSDGETDLLHRRRRLLPRQAASAASTAASSCSAPTTTATSVGCARCVGCFGDDPDETLEILIGQFVNLVAGRRAGPDEQAGRQRSSRWTTWSTSVGVDAARYSLVALVDRLDARPRPRLCSPAHQRQPGLVRAVRPRADHGHPRRAGAAGARHRARSRRGRRRAADPRARGRPAARAGRVPAHRRGAPRCAGPAPGRALPRGDWRGRTTASTTPAGSCRRATRRRPRCTPPACCSSRRPGSSSPTAWACSASPHRSGCERPPRPRRLAALGRAWIPTARIAWAACGSTTLLPNSAPRCYVLDEDDFRSAAGVPERRFRSDGGNGLLRRQGVPVPWRSPAGWTRRGCRSTSARVASWPSREPSTFRPSGSSSTATTSRSPSSSARIAYGVGADRRRLLRRDRPAASGRRGARRGQRVLIRVTPGVEAHTHEYVSTGQEDQKFGFSLASGAAPKRRVRVLATPTLELVGMHAHIGSQIFDTAGFRLAAHRMVGLLARRPRRARHRAGRARPRRRSRHRLHQLRTHPLDVAEVADPAAGARREGVRDGGSRRAARSRSSRAGHRWPGTVTLYEVGTVKESARAAHLRQRRRRHERQHPPRAVRRALHGGSGLADRSDAPRTW